MAKKDYTIEDGVAVGKLKIGFSIDGARHVDFQMREYDVANLLDAEAEASVTSPLAFNAHLMCLQLVKVGDFEGPITINMIRRLKAADWNILRSAQRELETLGEGGSGDSGKS